MDRSAASGGAGGQDVASGCGWWRLIAHLVVPAAGWCVAQVSIARPEWTCVAWVRGCLARRRKGAGARHERGPMSNSGGSRRSGRMSRASWCAQVLPIWACGASNCGRAALCSQRGRAATEEGERAAAGATVGRGGRVPVAACAEEEPARSQASWHLRAGLWPPRTRRLCSPVRSRCGVQHEATQTQHPAARLGSRVPGATAAARTIRRRRSLMAGPSGTFGLPPAHWRPEPADCQRRAASPVWRTRAAPQRLVRRRGRATRRQASGSLSHRRTRAQPVARRCSNALSSPIRIGPHRGAKHSVAGARLRCHSGPIRGRASPEWRPLSESRSSSTGHGHMLCALSSLNSSSRTIHLVNINMFAPS